ncbi:hypothetical protein IPN35_06740 [Candidatus Peregrinibacteria bacterium]|nr:MAG: hypothetical protein IPN35_06740 [Candidatus Peregrinibacteria bacterium]
MNISVQNLLGKPLQKNYIIEAILFFPDTGKISGIHTKNGAFFSAKDILFQGQGCTLSHSAQTIAPEGENILGYEVQSALNHASLGTVEDIEFSPSLDVLDRILVSNSLLGIGIPLTKRYFSFNRILRIEKTIITVDDDRTNKEKEGTLCPIS